MKIILVQDYLRSGGTERQSVLLANAFAAAGHATSLLTFRPGGALHDTVVPRVSRSALQRFDTHLDWFAPGLLAAVARLAPDVILCMGRMANCYGGRLQSRFPGAVVVGTMRTGKKLPARFRQSLERVRHVVANSCDARDTLIRDYAIAAEKVAVIHNALVFPAPPVGEPSALLASPLRVSQGASAKTKILLCVAMFRPEKNQRELIEIVAGLPPETDHQLWLAGEGPARTACERLVREQNLSARVKFLGFHRDASALYLAADIAVHASASEALSNFLIEAQAHGLPVIAYHAQGIAECFRPGHTGWVVARDDRSGFCTALQRVMALSPAERAQLAAAAREYARSTFDPQRQVAAYLALFQKLLASPAS